MLALRTPLETLLRSLRSSPSDAIDPEEAYDALGILEELSTALKLPASFFWPQPSLLALPQELLVQVCRHLPPPALAAAARTCRCMGGVRIKAGQQPIVELALRQQVADLPLVQSPGGGPRPGRRAMPGEHIYDPALDWPPYPHITSSLPGASELLCDAVRRSMSQPQFLSAARTHSVFLAPNGEVLTCGGLPVDDEESDVGEEGEGSDEALPFLGHGPGCSKAVRPKAICPVGMHGEPVPHIRFVAVAGGPSCTLAISELGEVYSCGSSRNSGVLLGHGRRSVVDLLRCGMESSLRLISTLQHDPVVAVACGLEHCLCLSESGIVRSWGVGIDGALGHGKHGGPAEGSPTIVEGLRPTRVTAIAAGLHHSVALSATGIVFTWGRAAALGVGDGNAHLHSPYPITQLLEAAHHDQARVCAIAAGGSHSLALAHTGAIYSWGTNANGQLGRPLDVDEPLPPARVADAPYGQDGTYLSGVEGSYSRVRFRAIACGAAHSVALSEAGHAYAWGESSRGRLGVRLSPEFRRMGYFTCPHNAADEDGVTALSHVQSPKVVVPLRVQGPQHLSTSRRVGRTPSRRHMTGASSGGATSQTTRCRTVWEGGPLTKLSSRLGRAPRASRQWRRRRCSQRRCASAGLCGEVH